MIKKFINWMKRDTYLPLRVRTWQDPPPIEINPGERIVNKDRIGVEYEATHGFSINQCDLCDEERYPMISWCCEHDDPAHITTVCLGCLCQIVETTNRKDLK